MDGLTTLTFLMGGFGLQRIGGIEGFRLNTMENAHIGVGKNFNPLSSARFYINVENALRSIGGKANAQRFYMVMVTLTICITCQLILLVIIRNVL